MSKYTPWFDPVTQPPVRVGWYPVEGENLPVSARRRWDGLNWSVFAVDTDKDTDAEFFGFMRVVSLKFKWRGLTAPHPEQGE